jgi:hypothetical protein
MGKSNEDWWYPSNWTQEGFESAVFTVVAVVTFYLALKDSTKMSG